MPKTILAATLCFGLAATLPTPGWAQQPSTDADRTIRQGDTIEWVSVSSGPHQVKFGGTVGGTTLPKISDVQAILKFPPAPAPQLTISGDIGTSPARQTGDLLSATVDQNAAPGTTFFFTCGIHPGLMLSHPFKIEAKVAGQPATTHKIKGGPGLNWFMEVARDASIDTTPPSP